ncbi:glucose-1-phosphate thymidylyltransferase [Streptomyces sp. NA02950]|uniref:glucose-1-phosphate thymidylyltransferase n=1 Tax=Streptomyces sp. NA02950 TaxID=2742137 RepID=UPI00159213D9|nr:glucose-1-phosphate thymidylyltransferase [Streptomyces sp. NA02950]QKV97159.1 glucose-1-phosphate thymidylyltransferase [Streptomyces sp. NA02950]
MRALVLCGGAGTRLRPITHTSAKQLVPVANKPVLFYGLEAIAQAGITDVGIIVSGIDTEIEQSVGDGSKFGIEATYIIQEVPLGIAHAVLVARDFLGSEDFVLYLGDNFIVGGITGLVDKFRTERPDAQILLTRVPDPTAFGVAELDGKGRLTSLVEKPKEPKSDLALVGVYFFTVAIHEAVRSIDVSWRGELEITHAIQWLVEQRKDVRSTTITGYWKDTGNVIDMLEVNRSVLEEIEPRIQGDVDEVSEIIGRVEIAEGARVRRSRVVGPAIIGTDTVVVDSYIGPYTSISEGCRIEDSEIEFSIVLRDASIKEVRRVHASLIGRSVEVSQAPPVPHAHRLVLGDHSKVEISS